ncbi:type II toxin-antitoxin system RelE/ParE family toxin [Flavobacterium silvaticum]|uniref:Type II toxin-antitoxin system RelE/ParE family toxin n=1 Tax=Flavobacterium silvaticum TaxID=1852020 RepID=A0A972JG41_9FLAO|nr:type II toxin-antitoxin system RelE/ParE family toxin [Flavobacterium silvaticum]NMH26460.1 type II toxin-antitoxin system RelE/ParE family toxin [Flavobacterium silvaticum]
MKNGYDILWTDHALKELANTINYLQENWEVSDLVNFAEKLENTVTLISQNPELFPKSGIRKDIYRAIIAKHNTLYYRVRNNSVEILSLFSHRQSKRKRKL